MYREHARLEPHPDASMLLTAVSEAVERYDPSTEAAILLEVASGYVHVNSEPPITARRCSEGR
jgi:hypothetical protein